MIRFFKILLAIAIALFAGIGFVISFYMTIVILQIFFYG